MNSTIEVSKSFKKFFTFVVLCIALGGVLSHRAQKALDEKWAQFSRSLAAKKIEVSRPTVVFARSGLPALGAAIEKLTHTGVSRCFEYQIKAEQLFLPLNVSKIFLGRLEFGTLQVESTHLQILESENCGETVKKNELNQLKNDFEDVISSSVNSDHKRPELFVHLKKWFSEHQPRISSMPLRHFYLKKIEIQGQTLKEKHLNAEGSLTIDLEDQLQAQLVFDKLVFGKTTRSLATQFRATLEATAENILRSGDWAYYEGHLLLEAKYSRSDEASISLQSKNLPLSVVNRWFDTPWTFQFVWFNCGLNLQTSEANWHAAPWALNSCQITGPHGAVEIKAKSIYSLTQVDDLNVNFQQIQLDQIIKGKEHLPFSRLIKDYGLMSGDLKIQGAKVESQLLFKDPSILFSRKNKRHLQVLDELKLALSYENSYYVFSLLDAKIRGGTFKGFAEAAYYKKQNKVVAKVQVPQLSFSKDIQTLMTSGELSPLSADGELEWSLDAESGIRGKLQMGFESYKNSFLNLSKGKILVGWSASVPQVAWTVDQVDIERSDSTLWIFASLLENEARQQLRLQQAYVNGDVRSKNKLDIKKATAYSPTLGRLSLVGQVDFVEGQGQAAWNLSNGQTLDWEWSYRAQDASWLPQNKAMRDWLQAHEDYLATYPFVR